MEGLSMSLDDLMAKSKKENSLKRKEEKKGKGGRGGGKAFKANRNADTKRNEKTSKPSRQENPRSSGPGKMLVRSVKPVSRGTVATSNREPFRKAEATRVSGSIFNRLGNASGAGSSVNFGNLVSTVETMDLSELCSTVGTVKEISLKFNPSTGKKSADVEFSNASEAASCIEKFNGVALDGVNMVVKLSGHGSEAGSATRKAFRATTAASYMEKHENNVRAGFFGSALGAQDSNPSANFKITFNGAPRGGGDSGGMFAGSKGRMVEVKMDAGDDEEQDQVAFNRTFQGPGHRERGGTRSRGAGRGRGKGRGGGPRDGGGASKKPVTAADLDAELDSYKGVSTSGGLDDDMDAYWAAKS